MFDEFKYFDIPDDVPENPLEAAGIHPHIVVDYNPEVSKELAMKLLKAQFFLAHPDRTANMDEDIPHEDARDISDLLSILKLPAAAERHVEDLRALVVPFCNRLEFFQLNSRGLVNSHDDCEAVFAEMLSISSFPSQTSLWSVTPREFILLPVGIRAALASDPSKKMIEAAQRFEAITYEDIPKVRREMLRQAIKSDFPTSAEGIEVESLVDKQLKSENPTLYRRYETEKANAKESRQYEKRSRELYAIEQERVLPESLIQKLVVERYEREYGLEAPRSRRSSARHPNIDEFAKASAKAAEKYAKRVVIQEGQLIGFNSATYVVGVFLGTDTILKDALEGLKESSSDMNDRRNWRGLPITALEKLVPNISGEVNPQLIDLRGWREVSCDNHFLISVSRSSAGKIEVNIEGEIQSIRERPSEPNKLTRTKSR